VNDIITPEDVLAYALSKGWERTGDDNPTYYELMQGPENDNVPPHFLYINKHGYLRGAFDILSDKEDLMYEQLVAKIAYNKAIADAVAYFGTDLTADEAQAMRDYLGKD
jgi:hypothetical protein